MNIEEKIEKIYNETHGYGTHKDCYIDLENKVKQLICEIIEEIIGKNEKISPHLTVGQDGFVRGRNILRNEQRQKLKDILE